MGICTNCIHKNVCDHECKYRTNCSQFLAGRSQWIPFSERLPEDGQLVLVTLNQKSLKDAEHPVIIAKYTTEKDSWIHTIPDVVLAWMPLPDPYNRGDSK